MIIPLRTLAAALTLTLFLILSYPASCQESDNKTKDQESAKPVTTSRLILNAQQAASEQKYKTAVQFASEVVQREPNDARHRMALANIYFMSAEMPLAIQEYDRTAELAPQLAPHLWQRGLALYFAEQYELGVKQFETHQTVNSQDVENAVWHMLCAAKISSVEKARKNLIPINKDSRIPMKEIHKLFAGTMTVDQVISTVVSKQDANTPIKDLSLNQRSQQYYAYLYVGLFQEMTGDSKSALSTMKRAAQVNPLPHNEVMGTVADVFLKLKVKNAAQKNDNKESAKK